VQVGSDKKSTQTLKQESWSQFNFRLVQVAMTMFLPLLAVALAVPPKRSTSALGVFISIVMVVTYYKISEYAQGMAALGTIDPFIGLWAPFLVFAALIVWMFRTLAYVPGGEPIGGLDRLVGKAFAKLRGLFTFFRKSPV
jgi:lipopolysaccharide export system permease protein